MALRLPPNFNKDIQGRDTALIPVVFIGNAAPPNTEGGWVDWLNGVAPIVISTNAGVFPTGFQQAKPLLLNIPSLKESIDIEKRNYKISSVNIDISNFPYEGKRFSELVGDSSLINTECRIQWASPSSYGLNQTDFSNPGGDLDMFFAYIGSIRRYEHDDEKVRLVVEDRSQASLHRDLPIANLGTGDDVPDKYKNKPIPMVYGHVDRSPCMFKVETLPNVPEYSALKNIIADSTAITFEEEQASLLNHGSLEIYGALFVGDSSLGYAPCARTFHYNLTTELYDHVFPYIGEDNQNYSYDNANATIILNDDADNDVKIGLFRGIIPRVPVDVKINSTAADGQPHSEGSSNGFIAIKNADGTQYTAGGNDTTNDNWLEGDITTNTPEAIRRIINDDINEGCHLKGTVLGSSTGLGGNEYLAAKIELAPSACGFDSDQYFIGAFFHHHEYDIPPYNTGIQWENIAVKVWSGEYVMPETEIANNGATWFSNTSLGGNNQENPFNLKLEGSISGNPSTMVDFNIGAPKYTFGDADAADAQVHIDIWSANIFHVTYIDKLVDRNFYANVNGRQSATPQAPEIIKDILVSELGQLEADIDVPTDYDTWKYAFTVDKKINSKKLIEGIASASPYMARFDNMGEFKFDFIKETYSPSDVTAPNSTILEADCIDYSFSRTKIEDVKTKVEFKYNWDYARKEFASSITVDVDDYYNYKYEYYVLPDDHSESTLIIDDDRGKYIRDDAEGVGGTAEAFARWMLMWSINQHLIMKVKLPLKYMNLEIGDIIRFDKVLGDVKPYGIDYTDGLKLPPTSAVDDEGQHIFPYFMVTSTNKTLEYCEISAIQMHYLGVEVLGCMEEGHCQYNPFASSQPEGACASGGNLEEDGRDCAGVCGGNAVEDCCGICNGASECYGNTDDITYCGACGENLIADECGVCEGDGIPEGKCDCEGNVLGCDNVCGSGLVIDDCGDCDGGNSGCVHCSDELALNFDASYTGIENACLYPITDTEHCFKTYVEYDGGNLPASNYICNTLPQYCIAPGGTIVNDGEGIWNMSSGSGMSFHFQVLADIQQYCIDNPDFCTQYAQGDSYETGGLPYPRKLSDDGCASDAPIIDISSYDFIYYFDSSSIYSPNFPGSPGGVYRYINGIVNGYEYDIYSGIASETAFAEFKIHFNGVPLLPEFSVKVELWRHGGGGGGENLLMAEREYLDVQYTEPSPGTAEVILGQSDGDILSVFDNIILGQNDVFFIHVEVYYGTSISGNPNKTDTRYFGFIAQDCPQPGDMDGDGLICWHDYAILFLGCVAVPQYCDDLMFNCAGYFSGLNFVSWTTEAILFSNYLAEYGEDDGCPPMPEF